MKTSRILCIILLTVFFTVMINPPQAESRTVVQRIGDKLEKAGKGTFRAVKFVTEIPGKLEFHMKKAGIPPVIAAFGSNWIMGKLIANKKIATAFRKAHHVVATKEDIEKLDNYVNQIKGYYREQAKNLNDNAMKLLDDQDKLSDRLIDDKWKFSQFKAEWISMENMAAAQLQLSMQLEQQAKTMGRTTFLKMAGKIALNRAFGEVKKIVSRSISEEFIKKIDTDIIIKALEGGLTTGDVIAGFVEGDIKRELKLQGSDYKIDYKELSKKIIEEIKNKLKEDKDFLKKNWRTFIKGEIEKAVKLKEKEAGYDEEALKKKKEEEEKKKKEEEEKKKKEDEKRKKEDEGFFTEEALKDLEETIGTGGGDEGKDEGGKTETGEETEVGDEGETDYDEWAVEEGKVRKGSWSGPVTKNENFDTQTGSLKISIGGEKNVTGSFNFLGTRAKYDKLTITANFNKGEATVEGNVTHFTTEGTCSYSYINTGFYDPPLVVNETNKAKAWGSISDAKITGSVNIYSEHGEVDSFIWEPPQPKKKDEEKKDEQTQLALTLSGNVIHAETEAPRGSLTAEFNDDRTSAKGKWTGEWNVNGKTHKVEASYTASKTTVDAASGDIGFKGTSQYKILELQNGQWVQIASGSATFELALKKDGTGIGLITLDTKVMYEWEGS